MPNSKHNSINNVIPFPLRTETPPTISNPTSQPTTQPLVLTRITRTASERALRKAAIMNRYPKQSQEENEKLMQFLSYEPTPCYALAEEKAAETIRKVLRHAKVNDKGNRRVYPSIQRDVDLMCEFNHPIGLMLQDWLDGNRRFLPDDITSMAKPTLSSEEVQS